MTLTDTPAIPAEPTALAPRSRRAILAAALGGLAATAATALGRPAPASAAAGSPLIIGSESNNAGTANTQLIANSDVVTFKLYQTGPGTALMGYTTTATGTTRGVYGRVDSPNGFGVQGRNAGAAGSGAAIQAIGVNNTGLDATTDTGDYAIRGFNNGSGGDGVAGYAMGGHGVFGSSGTYVGVYGAAPDGYAGVYGNSSSGIGVYGFSSGSWAGYFNGSLYAVSASASVKSFRIDHPLDPAGKVLTHSCVESNERKLVYDGVVTTDGAGSATIELPAWFGALNRDLRYQLTPMADVRAWVQQKVTSNRFTIATSEPGIEVCWQVTGVRADAYASAHPLVVESAKTGKEKGKYLNPLEHGQPESKGVDFELREGAAARP